MEIWQKEYDISGTGGPQHSNTSPCPPEEYVASIIGLYKDNGAVSCVGINITGYITGPTHTMASMT